MGAARQASNRLTPNAHRRIDKAISACIAQLWVGNMPAAQTSPSPRRWQSSRLFQFDLKPGVADEARQGRPIVSKTSKWRTDVCAKRQRIAWE